MPTPSLPLEMSKEEFGKWQKRVEASEKKRKDYEQGWKDNVSAAEGKPFRGAVLDDTVAVNKDLPRTKNKVAQLMFQIPGIVVRPKRPEFAAASTLYAAVINDKLQRQVKAHVVADEVLTDVVNASGIGVSKIGYEAVTDEVEAPPQLDPITKQPLLDSATGQPPAPQMVKRTLYEDYYWRRISPTDFVWASNFTGSDWDDADFLGWRFQRLTKDAIKTYNLPAEFGGGKKAAKREGMSETENSSTQAPDDDVVTGYEIWFWARRFDSTVQHPKKMRRLVIIDGHDKPAAYEDSPYQKEVNGKLVGMMRNPIRVLALTYISDKSVPPSDTAVSRPQVLELSESRSQMIRQRRRSLPIRWYDVNGIDDDDTLERMRDGNIQDMIPTNGPGDRVVGEIARANYPRENFDFQRVIENDLNEQWSMGPNQMGNVTPGETTAAEVKSMQGNASVRLDYERTKVLRWFTDGAELIGSLIQLFADNTDYVQVVGENGAKALQAWDKTTFPGEYAFDVKPDSALRIDVGADRQQKVNLYQMLANDPFVNRQKLVEPVLRAHNIDPTEVAATPQPPAPEKPNVSYRFQGPDLLNPIALTIMLKSGVAITPDDLKAAAVLIQAASAVIPPVQTPVAPPPGAPVGVSVPPDLTHGGPAQEVQPLSKHTLEGKAI